MTTPDSHPRRLKDAASQVKKLRGWAGSDATVAEPLVDALLEATALRLLAHDYADAAPDAQDALTRANGLVAQHGAVGPFTPVDDGVRFVTATTQLAVVQAGLGQPAAAGQMAAAARGWMRLLPHVDLAPYLTARTASWQLQARAAGALAEGDLAAANAFADAAVLRGREGGLAASDDARVLIDALLLAGDARWAAGVPGDALAFAREAAQIAHRRLAAQLARGRVADGQASRFVAPAARAGGDLADRLLAEGAFTEAVTERRALISALEGARAACGEAAWDAEVRARADLARDLAAGSAPDAVEEAGRAAEQAAALASAEARAGDHLAAQFAAVTAPADALVRADEPADARDALAALTERHDSLRRPEGLAPWLAVATLGRADAERAVGDAEASERSLRSFHEQVKRLRAGDPRGTLAVPDPAFALAAARGVTLRVPGPTPHWENLADDEALAASTRAHRTVADADAPVADAPEEITGTPTPQPFPSPQPGPAPVPPPHEPPAPAPAAPDAEPDAPARTPTPQPVPEPDAQPVPEPRPAAEPPQETAAVRPEPLQPEQAPAAGPASPLAAAEAALAAAKASGDRKATLTAAHALVDVARPLADADVTRTPALIAALEELGEALFRAGDWWGSRAPKKEAKTLARQLGR